MSTPGDGPLGFGDADDHGEERRPAHPARRDAAWTPARNPTPRGGGPLGLRRPGPGGWVLGAAVVVILALILLNTLRSDGPGSRGLVAGAAAPPFAAPLAGSKLAASDADVNYATRPDAGDAGAVPACSIARPDVLTSCALWRGRPAVVAFFATKGKQCIEEMDELDDVARRHPDVSVAAVAIRGDLGTVRDLQRDRGWRFPVAYDRDGVTANLYAVAVCPQLVFVAPGGRVRATSVGSLDARGLEQRFAALER